MTSVGIDFKDKKAAENVAAGTVLFSNGTGELRQLEFEAPGFKLSG